MWNRISPLLRSGFYFYFTSTLTERWLSLRMGPCPEVVESRRSASGFPHSMLRIPVRILHILYVFAVLKYKIQQLNNVSGSFVKDGEGV